MLIYNESKVVLRAEGKEFCGLVNGRVLWDH